MKIIHAILILFASSLIICAQSAKVDSLQAVLDNDIDLEHRLRTTDQLVKELVKSDPGAALLIARENLNNCKEFDDNELYGTAMLSMGQVYLHNRMVDSMKYIYQSSLSFFKEHQLYKLEGSVLRSMAVVAQLYGKLDSTLYYVDLCLQHLKIHPDSLTLGSAYFTQASVYYLKGYYKLSAESHLKSLRTYRAINDDQYVGYVLQGLGLTYLKIGRNEKAVEYNEQALAFYRRQENFGQVAQMNNNMGILYTRMELYEEARKALHESISISTEQNLTYPLVSNYHNLMHLEHSAGNVSLALSWAEKTDSLASIFGPENSRGEALRMKIRIALGRNDMSTANQLMNEALPYQRTYDDPEHSVGSYVEMGEFYNQLGQFEKAYASLERGKMLQDSIFTLEKNTQIEELSLIYETEKKDAQIVLLNKEAELDDTRKKALWGGLGLLVLSSFFALFGLNERNRKKRAIELEKRNQVEQELEFKKKELTAKALQLASKNEFLSTLEEEVAQLSSSVDASVTKTSARISRMIQSDGAEEDEWQQFSKEFSSVHQDFVDNIQKKYGSFTSGEMRLVSLLKMNLSSKEIANILRVSDEGIKKARYRLRKKMKLESRDDLSGVILAL